MPAYFFIYCFGNIESKKEEVQVLLAVQNEVNNLVYWKDIINIIFWIVNILFLIITAVVGVQTYRNARRTLFQPIRTEIFKEQLKEFSEILKVFNERSFMEFREAFAFLQFEVLNRRLLLQEYYTVVLELEDPEFYTRESHEKFFSVEDSLENLEIDLDHYLNSNKDSEEYENSSLGALDWNKRKVRALALSDELYEKRKALLNLNTSPLLTEKCRDLIGAFGEQLDGYFTLYAKIQRGNIKKLLEEPSILNDIQSLFTAEQAYELNSKVEDLHEEALKIMRYVSEYFGTNDIVPKTKTK
ncbi:hypothetical protein B9G55_01365 [Saccharibacillus sp. O16]|nr:hypothetical protein B9G55_01365 [Saccharibacillus sp. O16]